METKLRLAFFKDWHDDIEHIGGNQDGILAAVAELSKRHNLLYVSRTLEGSINGDFHIRGVHTLLVENGEQIHWDEVQHPDVAIFWGSLDRPWHESFGKLLRCPKILCFAGGPTTHPNLHNFDHVLVESGVYEKAFNQHIIGVSRAFGTNTNVFRPEPRTPKVFDAIYPASFCQHKNIETFARAMGHRGLAVGQWNDLDIVGKCLQFDLPVMRRVSSAALCDLLNLSRVCVVPCGTNGGAQRVVLEAMACGVPVVLANDNDKCAEFVEESGFGRLVHPIDVEIRAAVDDLIAHPLDPKMGRDYVMSKWTHHHYADAIERAIREVMRG